MVILLRFYVGLFSLIALWNEGTARCADCPQVCPCVVVLRTLGARGGLRSLILILPRNLFIAFC